jgi:hypothetical protein
MNVAEGRSSDTCARILFLAIRRGLSQLKPLPEVAVPTPYGRSWKPSVRFRFQLLISQPVELWHGSLDNWAPPAMADALAASLPNITALHELE